MSISRVNFLPPASVVTTEASHSSSSPARPGGTASSSESRGFAEVLRDAASSIARGQARVDRALRRGRRQDTSPAELLALQAGVYRFNQELELASKVVEKATGAVKTTLQSQQ